MFALRRFLVVAVLTSLTTLAPNPSQAQYPYGRPMVAKAAYSPVVAPVLVRPVFTPVLAKPMVSPFVISSGPGLKTTGFISNFGTPYVSTFGSPFVSTFGSPFVSNFGTPFAPTFGTPFAPTFISPGFGSPFLYNSAAYGPYLGNGVSAIQPFSTPFNSSFSTVPFVNFGVGFRTTFPIVTPGASFAFPYTTTFPVAPTAFTPPFFGVK